MRGRRGCCGVRVHPRSLGPIPSSRELSLAEPWFRYHGTHLHWQVTEDPPCCHGRCGAATDTQFADRVADPFDHVIRMTMTARPDQDNQALDALKRSARMTARSRRANAFRADAGPLLATRVLEVLAEVLASAAGQVVSAFWPLAGEIDTLPAMTALHERGFKVVLPVMLGAGKPLIFRLWQPGDRLEEAAFDTREPSADKEEMLPEILLVPLLAFDRAGFRLGYGGGFYDRTLAKLRRGGPVTTLGIAFAGQACAAVPRGAFDQKLDWIVTESESIHISKD